MKINREVVRCENCVFYDTREMKSTKMHWLVCSKEPIGSSGGAWWSITQRDGFCQHWTNGEIAAIFQEEAGLDGRPIIVTPSEEKMVRWWHYLIEDDDE